jgi:hypothetical protein
MHRNIIIFSFIVGGVDEDVRNEFIENEIGDISIIFGFTLSYFLFILALDV